MTLSYYTHLPSYLQNTNVISTQVYSSYLDLFLVVTDLSNVYREYFGLPKIKTFNEINPPLFENNPDLLQKLIQVYDGRLDNIDVYIGKFKLIKSIDLQIHNL